MQNEGNIQTVGCEKIKALPRFTINVDKFNSHGVNTSTINVSALKEGAVLEAVADLVRGAILQGKDAIVERINGDELLLTGEIHTADGELEQHIIVTRD